MSKPLHYCTHPGRAVGHHYYSLCFCGYVSRCDNCDRPWRDHTRADDKGKCLYGPRSLRIRASEDYLIMAVDER